MLIKKDRHVCGIFSINVIKACFHYFRKITDLLINRNMRVYDLHILKLSIIYQYSIDYCLDEYKCYVFLRNHVDSIMMNYMCT